MKRTPATYAVPKWRWITMCILLGFSAPISFVAVLGGAFYVHKAASIAEGGVIEARAVRARTSVIDFHVSMAVRRAMSGETVTLHDHSLVEQGRVWPLGTANAALLRSVMAAVAGDRPSYQAARELLVRAVHGQDAPQDQPIGTQTLYALSSAVTTRALANEPLNVDLTDITSLAAFQATRAASRGQNDERWMAFADASCTIVPFIPGCVGRAINGLVWMGESFNDLGRRTAIADPPIPLNIPDAPAPRETPAEVGV